MKTAHPSSIARNFNKLFDLTYSSVSEKAALYEYKNRFLFSKRTRMILHFSTMHFFVLSCCTITTKHRNIEKKKTPYHRSKKVIHASSRHQFNELKIYSLTNNQLMNNFATTEIEEDNVENDSDGLLRLFRRCSID